MKMMMRLLCALPLLLVGCVFYRTPDGWIPARVPLTIERLVEMKNDGDSDATIKRELAFHGVEYKLNADDLVALKEAGAGDSLLKAAAEAPVKAPAEARPIYHRHSHAHYDYDAHYAAVPVYIGAALSLNYIFGRNWGCRPRSRW